MSISHRINVQERATKKKVNYDENYTINDKKEQPEYHRWSLEENYSYLLFLENNKERFYLKKGAKKRKGLFQLMSEHLGAKRNNAQCRTHHEKMVKKYRVQDQSKDILPIIIGMRNKKSIQEYALKIQHKEIQAPGKFEQLEQNHISLKKQFEEISNQGIQQQKRNLLSPKQKPGQAPVKLEEEWIDEAKINQKVLMKEPEAKAVKKQANVRTIQPIKIEVQERGAFNQVKKECTGFMSEQLQNQYPCFNSYSPYFMVYPYFSPDAVSQVVKQEEDL